MRITHVTALFAWASMITISTGAYAANCEFAGGGPATPNYWIPRTLNVPRDMPVGSIIWEGSNRVCENQEAFASSPIAEEYGTLSGSLQARLFLISLSGTPASRGI